MNTPDHVLPAAPLARYYRNLSPDLTDSSVVDLPLATRWVWIVMLSLTTPHGTVRGTITTLARRANVTIREVEEALEHLTAPDPRDRSGADEGRRVVAIRGGWRVVNFDRYHRALAHEAMRTATAERVRRHRARRAADATPPDLDEAIANDDPPHGAPSPGTEAPPREDARPLPMNPADAVVDEMAQGRAWSSAQRRGAVGVVRGLLGDGHAVPLILAAWRRYAEDPYWAERGLPIRKFSEHFGRYAAPPRAAARPTLEEAAIAEGREVI